MYAIVKKCGVRFSGSYLPISKNSDSNTAHAATLHHSIGTYCYRLYEYYVTLTIIICIYDYLWCQILLLLLDEKRRSLLIRHWCTWVDAELKKKQNTKCKLKKYANVKMSEVEKWINFNRKRVLQCARGVRWPTGQDHR